MKKLLLLPVLFFLLSGAYAQKEANYWYFGINAGVNFGLGVPVALTDGQLVTGEGCSSISSSSGQLLFYTDGSTVWNSTHQVMQNGTGLHGHSSSTQSGLIVPNPSSNNIYYIFTVDARENNLAFGLQYSVVDMSANGGLGMVDNSQKNIQLVAPACEKVTAVGNFVGNGFWVITHHWGSNAFYAYEITGSGVNTTPVISNVGAVITGDMEFSKGYIKVSPDGNTLTAAHNELTLVEIFDFNTQTGVVSNPISDYNYQYYGYGQGGPYGVEYSTDSKKLYISEWKDGKKIWQYDLEAGSPAQILASRVLVASVGQGDAPLGALQLGPDNRMYIARNQHGYLSRINFPNNIGVSCGFESDAVYLAGRESRYGLSPFIQSFFNANVEFFYETPACYGVPTQFYLSASVDPDSVFWNFGDYASGEDNYSTEWNPTHLFTDTLNHFVTLTYYLSSNTEIIVHGLATHTFPEIDLGEDSAFCYVEPYVLDPGGYTTYLWQDGSTDPTFTVTTNGLYWCEVTNQWGCPDRDSVYLTVGQEPVVEVSSDETLIPFGTSTGLHGTYTGGNGPFSYQWEPSELVQNPNSLESETENLESTTTFTLYVTDGSAGCTGEQSVTVYVTGGPLGVNATASPTQVCLGGTSLLNALPSGGTGDYTYAWTSNPGSWTSDLQSPTVQPDVTTTYTVVLDDGLSVIQDQVTISVNPDPVANAGTDQNIPYGTTTTLQGSGSVGSGNYSWHWSPAVWLEQTNVQYPETKNITETVQFTLYITDNTTGCVSEEDFVVVTPEGGPLSVNIQTEDPEICQGNSSVLTAYASGGYEGHYTYTWTDEHGNNYPSEPSITVNPYVTTEYQVTVFDEFNTISSEFTLTVFPGAFFTLAGGEETIFACPYDTVVLMPDPHPQDWTYLWSNGSTEPSIKVGSTGIGFDLKTFSLSTISANGCTFEQEITIIFDFGNCFGTEEYTIEPVRIYPNPGNGSFSFEGISGNQWNELKIYSLQSQQVYYEKLPQHQGSGNRITRDLSFLPPGVYFVILLKDGVKATGKMVLLP